MTGFIATPPPPAAQTIANDGWYPALEIADFRAATGLGTTWGNDRVAPALTLAMIHVNTALAEWRATRPESTLSAAPNPNLPLLYRWAVYGRARAELLLSTRDYDSTRDGHDRATMLEATAADWSRRSAESLAAIMGRSSTVVELI